MVVRLGMGRGGGGACFCACVCVHAQRRRRPSSWGLAWSHALPRCPKLAEEFLRGVGWVDKGWVGCAIKK